METNEIKSALTHVLSQLTPDVHLMEAENGWSQVGAIISFQELGQFGIRVSCNKEGVMMFETVFGQLPLTKENLLLLNQYNLSSVFRAAVDEDGYLNLDFTYLGLKRPEEIEEAFTHLMQIFADTQHIELLRPLARKAVFDMNS